MADQIEMKASMEIRQLLSRRVVLKRSTVENEMLRREHEQLQGLGYLLSQMPDEEPDVVPLRMLPQRERR